MSKSFEKFFNLYKRQNRKRNPSFSTLIQAQSRTTRILKRYQVYFNYILFKYINHTKLRKLHKREKRNKQIAKKKQTNKLLHLLHYTSNNNADAHKNYRSAT